MSKSSDERLKQDIESELLRKVTLTINAFFGWEFNSCESLRKGDTGIPSISRILVPTRR